MSDLFAAAAKGNARASGYVRQADDWYREPRWSIDALLDAERFAGTIHDPACGSGNIPMACRAHGYIATGSDIVDRGFNGPVVDFLIDDSRVANFITNPPFNLSEKFVLHALERCDQRTGKVAVLQHTSWLEGRGRHVRLFSLGHLLRVWQFKARVSMPPGDSNAEAKGGSKAFAWCVFAPWHRADRFEGGWI